MLVSCCLINCLLKLLYPVANFSCLILYFKNHQAIISVDSVVDCQAEVGFGFFKKVICNQGYIDDDDTDLEKKTNQFINDISNFNNEHIIQCNNKHIYNIPEETGY